MKNKCYLKQRAALFVMLIMGAATVGAQQVLELNYKVNVENEVIRRYMKEVSYMPGEPSRLNDYKSYGGIVVYHPNPLVIDVPYYRTDSLHIVCCDAKTHEDSIVYDVFTEDNKVTLYNLIPQRTYYYEVKDDVGQLLQKGQIATSGQVRMLRIDGNVLNVRDLGGIETTDGMRIRYGKLFRGSELNWAYEATPEGLAMLRQLGVDAEIDMRNYREAIDNQAQSGVSVFGFHGSSSTPAGEVPTYLYTNDSGQIPSNIDTYLWKYKWRQEFEFIVNNLRVGRGIYYHCILGRDRTGYLSFLLEGLLGVPYNELIKDYELSFMFSGIDKKEQIDETFDFIDNMEGATLRDRFNSYFRIKLGVSQEDIDFFCAEMLEEVPEEPENPFTPTTGITATPQSASSLRTPCYDLQGRRISDAQPRRGICVQADGQGGYRKVISSRQR